MPAVSGGALAVVLHLLQQRAAPNAASQDASFRGATALHFLGDHRSEAFAAGAASMIAESLVGAGANPAARDVHGQTVLHVAAKNPMVTPDFFDKILSFGLAVDELDAFGCTPLWHAAFANELGHVTYLLSRGADPNSRSTAASSLAPAGTSVYEAARKRGDFKLLAALRDAGALTAQQHAAEAESGSADPFAVGARVTHSKFGEGAILLSEGHADERKLTVHFADGTRVLLAKFLSPAS
jgi:ankyrin repeat protein